MSLDLPIGALWALPLASVRTLAMFMSAPIFGHNAVPVRIRAALGLAFAVVAIPLATPTEWVMGGGGLALGAAVINEALIGVSLGFGLRVIFMVFAPLGEVISIQGGLGAATVLDPTSGTSSPVVGSLLQAAGLVLFLVVDGHHALLRGLAGSYERLPLGESLLHAGHFSAIVALGSSLFEVAVRLAAPLLVVMFIVNVAVGILGRAIPQLNLMSVQLPAQIGITLIVLALAAAPLSQAIIEVLTEGSERAIAAVAGG